MSRFTFVLVMTALALAACGSNRPAVSPVPVVTAGAGITAASNGEHVTLHVHDSVNIYLTTTDSFDSWDAIRLSGDGVVILSRVVGGYPRDAFSATLTAVHPGQVDLISQTDASCFHTRPACGLPSMLFDFNITVVA